METHTPTIGVAILAYFSRKHLESCLPPILQSPLHPKVLIVDSSSNDGTVEYVKTLGLEAVVISQKEFNHGLTREMARKHLNTDVVVMITPDAYLLDGSMLEKLVRPIIDGHAALAYGRQIPHCGAKFFEAFPRKFNYPDQSHIRTIHDVGRYGVYTFFCSDSFAAYSNKALDCIGGFPKVLLGEDTVAAALLLKNNAAIAYVAEAVARHSHHYSLKEEFHRSFDTGLARKEYACLLQCGQSDEKRGRAYIRAMIKELLWKRIHFIPYAFMHLFVRWGAYRLGRFCFSCPKGIKKMFSGQKYYWQ